MSTSSIRRRRHGKGFTYKTGFGETVTDAGTLTYLKGLAIPPAWQDVEISPRPKAKVLATGYDAAGRKQYIYNPGFRERREKAKFDRLLKFAEALPRMRQVTGCHLRTRTLSREKVLACMVRLIDEAHFRVGSEVYARTNKTYGLATLRSRHLTIDGDKLIFDYTGKAHQKQHKEVTDRVLARVVREVDELPGCDIFKYYDSEGSLVDVTSDDVNRYIKEVMGEEFSAKDFRTWAGTLVAATALDAALAEQGTRPLKKHVVEAVKNVAGHLGNTPSIAKASYIDPRVIDHFLNGTTLTAIRQDLTALQDSGDLDPNEAALVRLLERRLVRKRLNKT